MMNRKFSSAASSPQTMQFHSNPSSSSHPPCHSSLSHRLLHHHHQQQHHHHHRQPQDRDSFLESANFLERESFLGRESFRERTSFLPSKETPFVDQENGSFTYNNRHHHHQFQHHQQNHIPSGSPNFLKPTEIHQSFRQRGPSDLCFSSTPSYPSEERRRRISSGRSSEPSFSKFSASEGITAYNVSENAYIPRTPQTEDFGMASSSPYVQPASNAKFIPSAYTQPRNCERQDFRMASAVNGSDHHMTAPQKQVKLYRWYLIKCGTSSVEIAVGGLLSPGTVGSRRQEMAAITKRNDKCRLMTKDGVEVRLTGLIDDCTTIANGFSVEIVHLFLSGFPYTWNHLLQNEFQTCTIKNPICLGSGTDALNSIETSELNFEGCANKEKCLPLLYNSQMDTSAPSGKKVDATAYQENNTKLPLDEILQLSASSAMGGQDLQKYGTHTAPSTHNTMELHETTSSSQKSKDELHENAPVEKTDNVLGVPREIGEAHVLDSPVIPKENVRKTRDGREKSTQKSQLPKRVTRSMQRASRHMDGNENKIMNGATNCADASENIQRTNLEAKDVNASFKVITDTPIKEEAVAHLKKSMRKSGKNNRQQNDMKEDFVDSAQNLNSFVDKDVDIIMDTIEHLEGDEHTPQESEHAAEVLIDSSNGTIDQGKGTVKNSAQHSINIESMPDGEMEGKIHSRSEGRRLSSAEVIDFPNCFQEICTESQSCKEKQTEIFPPIKRKMQSRPGEKRLSSSLYFPNSSQETETERHGEKEAEMIPSLKGKAQLRSGERTSCNSESDLTNSLEDEKTGTGSQSHEDNEMHGSCRLGLISLTKGKIQSISEERRLSSSEVIDLPDCLQEIGDESQSHAREMRTPCRTGMIPPPLPSPSVPVSKNLISAAFGLKTSRSGRLLVPPLAHWCSQSIVRDKDGGIIAISNGSMNMDTSESGYSKFRPPAETNLQNLQKRLHEAAVEGLKKKTMNKKKKVKRN